MASGNTSFLKAREEKNDEFYTKLEDIESEISMHPDYVREFQGKTVFCNCDDPEWSNFHLFFRLHFRQLGLKKLITTHYNQDGSPSYKIEWEGEMLGDDCINMIKTPLKCNGDFRSEECVELLKQADIIVTNPPFSIAREEYIPLLYKYDKQFVIIGDLNWSTYQEIFPIFMENKIAFGYTSVKEFKTPSGEYQKFGNKVWFTNLDIDKRHEGISLTKNYYGNEDRYPTYDNYAAINVDKVKDIPKDYMGVIGVPITYLAYHNADQFEIVGITDRQDSFGFRTHKYSKEEYKNANDLNRRACIVIDGKPKPLYARILIKRKV